jgi:hypothetical protein
MDIALPLLLFLPEAARYAIATSLGLGIGIAAIMYLVAYLSQHPPIFAIAKEELAATIFSVIIVLFFISSSVTLDPLVNALISPAPAAGFGAAPQITSEPLSDLSSSHVTLALACLDILFHKLKEMYTSMYLFEALIGFLSTISFPLGSPQFGTAIISFSLMPFDGLVLLSNAHTIIVESIGQLMTLIWAKEFLLLFVRDVIPIIFLPIGLIFRAFPFFRTTGSSIIAICFAGYFILPLAIIFSNFLIFDIYQPSDFIYAPEQMGPYSGDISEVDVTKEITDSRKKGNEILNEFAKEDVIKSTKTTSECEGNPVSEMLCSIGHFIGGIASGVWTFAKTIFGIWVFMMGMTGDFLSFITNFFSAESPFLPASASAGLYFFIIDAVVAHGQFLVVVVFTSLLEIIFTITMYRQISMLIGGELEIAGLTKLV